MGGIETDQNCETRIKGLFAVGECSSVGLHGANRLGSNSLAELVVFGRLAGEQRQSVQQLPVMATKRQLKRRQLALNNV
ncbi:fumarate reductase flavoprotein subunit [Escherichia coli]|uniref:Fumarate reductase flavoprotein subunit n=1 Tax=Escherichia coli TaxID=562 RepID=A0A376VZA4_ECOLX|nr:fumarate reductase flavoprotein subunit [Escherichia coli]